MEYLQRYQIIDELKKYFSAKELVSEQVYKKYKEEKCWSFFSTELLLTLLIIRRDIIKCPMIINNWSIGGSYDERGLRCNLDPIVKNKISIYLSAHCLGQGLDFSTKEYTATECRNLIRENAELLPFNIRLESDKSAPTWVHFDVCNTTDNKIIEFNA